MRAPAIAAVALVLGLAAPPGARAQDAGRRARDGGAQDGGTRDGGTRDGGSRDGGSRDGGSVDGGGAAAAVLQGEPSDEQPAVGGEDAPLPEGHEPEVTLAIEPREGLATGDLVHVLITVRLPDGDDVAVPRQPFGPFELHDQRHHDRPIDGGRREYSFEIDLLALEPGEHELPALRLRVVTAAGDVGSVRTTPQRIVVGSLIANEPDAQPRPPTEPVPVMQDDYTLAWVFGILGAMLLTALLTWLLARWWSRRPKKVAPPPPPRPAWETALEKLTALHRRRTALLEEGKHVELVDGVSDALREYFGARFDFNGLESTTDEVLSRLARVRLTGTTLQEVAALLGDCDLVKFAKAVPSADECDRMIAGAVKIVRATMPGAAPAIAPAAQPAGSSKPPPAPRDGGTPQARPREVPITRESPAMTPSKIPEAPPVEAPAAEPAAATEIEAGAAERAEPDAGGAAAGAESAPRSGTPTQIAGGMGTAGAPIVLPLAVASADALDAVVSAAVLGTAEARGADPDFDGTIVVRLGATLPDEYASRQALRAVLAKLTASLDDRRTEGGAPLRVVIEHFHESPRVAADAGREPRKTVYAPEPGDRPTPTGNAFEGP